MLQKIKLLHLTILPLLVNCYPTEDVTLPPENAEHTENDVTSQASSWPFPVQRFNSPFSTGFDSQFPQVLDQSFSNVFNQMHYGQGYAEAFAQGGPKRTAVYSNAYVKLGGDEPPVVYANAYPQGYTKLFMGQEFPQQRWNRRMIGNVRDAPSKVKMVS